MVFHNQPLELSGETPATIEDADRDSLHILPLAILPLRTPALRKAKLIKNIHLQTVVEFFEEEGSGSGQVDIERLASMFGWPRDTTHPDLTVLRKLSRLPSFDVYSLRIMLRENGIPVDSIDALRLSKTKRAQLSKHMTFFTRPLMEYVYGEEIAVGDFGSTIELFEDLGKGQARDNLKTLSKELGITLMEVPVFLEDYADTFLSLSYYRQCLDEIAPVIEEFLNTFDGLRDNWQLRQDKTLMNTCTMIQTTINELMTVVTGRVETFERKTMDVWSDISAEKFQEVADLIRDYRITIGGILCSLSVKMHAWNHRFPNPDVGGPIKRSEFILSEMREGMESIRAILKQSAVTGENTAGGKKKKGKK